MWRLKLLRWSYAEHILQVSPAIYILDPRLLAVPRVVIRKEVLMFKTIAAATLLLLAGTVGANASSGKSWDALFAKANGTCIGQSSMVSPEVSSPVVFRH